MKSRAVISVALLSVVLILTALFGCSTNTVVNSAEGTPTPLPEETMNVGTPPSDDYVTTIDDSNTADAEPSENPAKETIGFIVADDGGLLTRSAMHGLLRTAENLNYPSILYRVTSEDSAIDLVDRAASEGCAGLVIWVESQEMANAAKYAKQKEIPVVASMANGNANTFNIDADSVLSADPMDYSRETVRTMCETAISRGNKEGTIIIARQEGKDQYMVDAFQAAINELYPQYTLTDIPVLATREATEASAKEYLKDGNNREIIGIFALAPSASSAWYNAEIAAEKQYDFKINPAIMALDYTDENLSLVGSSNILGLIARPYYTCAAQATMVLDSLLNGADIQESIRVNAPIIRRKDIEKYSSIVNEVKTWFGM